MSAEALAPPVGLVHLLGEVLASANVGIVVLDTELRYRAWTRYLEHALGQREAEVRGRPPWEVFPDLAAQGIEEALRQALAGEVVETSRRRVQPAGGGPPRWFRSSLGPLRGNGGCVIGIIGVLVDCTAQGDVEERLRLSEESLRGLLDSSPDGVLVARDGKLLYANRALAERLGFVGPEELIGRGALALIHPDDQHHARACMEKLARGERPPPHETRLRSRAGELVYFESHGTRTSFDGAPATAAILRDLTERRQLQAQAMAADRLASMGLLAASVAHELNNPLAALVANLDVALSELEARQEEGDASLAECLEDARDAAWRLRDIVRDIKLFSRSDEERRVPVDLHRVIDSAVRLAWNEIRHRARLVRTFEPVPRVDGNASRLGQVFLNLLLNAAQAIAPGDAEGNAIRVSTYEEGGCAVVEVSDTGHGVPPEAHSRVFEPLFTTKPVGEGTGLGLHISRRLVEELGGRIELTSEAGQGATFRVWLPASTREPSAVDASEPEPASTDRARVLVIDDEPAVSRAVARILGGEHDVTVSTSAAEALARIRTGERYDVVLCDLMMPAMTGPQLFAELERAAPELTGRVAFMTGGVFSPEVLSFLEDRRSPRLQKPFTPQALRATVAALLRGGA